MCSSSWQLLSVRTYWVSVGHKLMTASAASLKSFLFIFPASFSCAFPGLFHMLVCFFCSFCWNDRFYSVLKMFWCTDDFLFFFALLTWSQKLGKKAKVEYLCYWLVYIYKSLNHSLSSSILINASIQNNPLVARWSMLFTSAESGFNIMADCCECCIKLNLPHFMFTPFGLFAKNWV